MNERPIEYRFVLQHLTTTAPKAILDVGSGTTSFPHLLYNCGFHVTAIDNVRDYWASGEFANRHFHIIDDDIRKPRHAGQYDFVTCISVLEHIPEYDAAVDAMFGLLRPGGRLALTFPYNECRYYANAYKLPGAGYGQDEPYICQIYSRAQLDGWVERNRATIAAQEYWEVFTGELWTSGQRLQPPVQTEKSRKHHLTCLLLQKGDQ
jgi:SAM-dependent methyltransferase